ncbi:MAG: GAF domain-containing protein [Bacteroidota bacterium]
MTKAIPTTAKAPANGQACPSYLPVRAFFEKMSRTKEVIPYKSTFSFRPFIEKMRERKKGLQNAVDAVDSAFMGQAIEQLSSYLDPDRLDTPEKREEVMALLFPALFFEGQLGFVAKPFTKEFFFMTPTMQDVFTSDEWEIKVQGMLEKGKMGSPAMEAGKLILSTFHGQNFGGNTYQTMTFRHRETQLERHFKVNVVLEFIKTTPLKPVQELNGCDLHQLYNEWENEEYWLELFPPEDYTFDGLVVGYVQDVTEVEVLSEMKQMLITDVESEDEDPAEVLEQLNRQISSYLSMPDMVFGNLMNRDFKYAHLSSWSLMGGVEELAAFTKEDFEESVTYGKASKSEKAVIIGDLQRTKGITKVEQQLIDKGYRSLLLHPFRDQEGKVLGVMEFGSREAYRFNRQILDKLGEIISLFTLGTQRWIQTYDNKISFFIQKQFTYIHPSVEWKFQEVSQQFLLSPPDQEEAPVLEQIGFKNVYPLYGQADIVGSSKIRNESIQADMLDNLQRVQKVIKAFRKRLQFQLLDIYHAQTAAFVQRLENGGYVSSDESQIVELLVGEIHPLLRELSDKYEQLPKGVLKKYFDYLDPRLDIVYRERKRYEDSVHDLNTLISQYIDKEVAKKQEVLPHFFEKYTTDGVEYNIYLGQSLLPEGKFSYYFLKDFRLWQLMLMCEITRLVEKNRPKFQVPLTTAQLVFVYNNDLSICFNMDEKQFDVDGAYNVRYEILKKRIDKAVIKGTKERLTQQGKVAIVWLQEKDRIEYLEYLQHLRDQGLITDDIEELELERLQGADGLKALRVTVAL